MGAIRLALSLTLALTLTLTLTLTPPRRVDVVEYALVDNPYTHCALLLCQMDYYVSHIPLRP